MMLTVEGLSDRHGAVIGTGGWRHRHGQRFSLAKLLVVILAVGVLLAAVVLVVGWGRKAAGAGEWKPIAAPLKGVLPRDARPIVQLPDPDGRIFTGNELYDPKTKPDGSWAKAARTLRWNDHTRPTADPPPPPLSAGYARADISRRSHE
ncbi:MAG: hypothetical protein WKF86_08935 [Acidimicrobiales bacterium]